MSVPPPVGPPPSYPPPQLPDQAHLAAPQVADALNHGAQPAPAAPAPHAAVTPPGLSVSLDNSTPKAHKADKGQIAYNVIKLVGLVAVSPIAIFAGIFYMAGWTVSAMAGSSNPREFKEYMGEGLINVFHPVIEIFMGIHQGIQGHPVEEDEEETPPPASNGPPAAPAPLAQPAAGQPGVGRAEEERVMAEAERPPEHAVPAAPAQPAPQPGVDRADDRGVREGDERPPEHAAPAAGGDVAAERQRVLDQEAAQAEAARRAAEERHNDQPII